MERRRTEAGGPVPWPTRRVGRPGTPRGGAIACGGQAPPWAEGGRRLTGRADPDPGRPTTAPAGGRRPGPWRFEQLRTVGSGRRAVRRVPRNDHGARPDQERRLGHLRWHIEPLFAERTVDKIDTRTIEAYPVSRRLEGDRRLRVTPLVVDRDSGRHRLEPTPPLKATLAVPGAAAIVGVKIPRSVPTLPTC